MMLRHLGKLASGHRSRHCSSAIMWVRQTSGMLPPVMENQYLLHRPRAFATEADPASPSLNKTINDLEVTTKDFGHHFVASQVLGFQIAEAEKNAAKDFDMAKLKQMYYALVRPELVSRLLIHGHGFNDISTHWLKYQTHGCTKDGPRFTSCYDIMLFLAGLREEYWVFFFDYLARERIAVIEDWTASISTIQHLLWDLGLKDLAGNIHFYKGEADASWHEETLKADLSNLIWKDDQVISAITHLNVDSTTIGQGEAKSAFAILTKAKELGIENFVLCTDNKEVCGVLNGTKHVVPGDKDWKLYMAIRSLRVHFKRLVVILVPRELMGPADGMLRQGVKYPRYMKQSAKQWAHLLNGLPLFKLTLTPTATKAMKSFGKPIIDVPKNLNFYVELDSDQKKLTALDNIIKVLNPQKLYIAVKDFDSKPEQVQSSLADLIGNSLSKKFESWSVFCNDLSSYDPKRTLLVVFDGICPPQFHPHVNLTVMLSTAKDRERLAEMNVTELSASSYIFYHGVCAPTYPGKKG